MPSPVASVRTRAGLGAGGAGRLRYQISCCPGANYKNYRNWTRTQRRDPGTAARGREGCPPGRGASQRGLCRKASTGLCRLVLTATLEEVRGVVADVSELLA
jgi:hypothetical protein